MASDMHHFFQPETFMIYSYDTAYHNLENIFQIGIVGLHSKTATPDVTSIKHSYIAVVDYLVKHLPVKGELL